MFLDEHGKANTKQAIEQWVLEQIVHSCCVEDGFASTDRCTRSPDGFRAAVSRRTETDLTCFLRVLAPA